MLILFNIIFMIFYDFKNLKKVNFKLETINYSNIKKLLLGGFFAFGFSFLTLYVINAPKYIIDFLLTNSDQTIYGIIAMPATVLILFGQYIIQPFLVMLKEKLKTSKKEFIKLTLQMCSIILAFGAICIIAGYLLGIPILQLLYGLNLKKNRIDIIKMCLEIANAALLKEFAEFIDISSIEKKDFHFLDKDIVDSFNEAKNNPALQAQVVRESNKFEEREDSMFNQKDYDRNER